MISNLKHLNLKSKYNICASKQLLLIFLDVCNLMTLNP
jgi:hypothetical protein